MISNSSPRAGKNLGALCVIGALCVGLAACGSSGKASLPGAGGGSEAGGSAGGGVLANAPVASAAEIGTNTTMAKIRQRGQLLVGGTSTAPLFALQNPATGQVEGFDADMARLLAQYIIGKPNVKRVQTTAKTRETLLQNGTVDTVIATYTITAKRAKLVAFAGPYYASGDAILVKKSNSSITGPKDLNGKNVCTESNSTAANDIGKFAPGAKVTLLETNDECLTAVEQGRDDAYVLDQGILAGDVTRHADVQVVGQPFTKEPYGIGLPKNDPAYVTFINDWLKKIESGGQWATAYKNSIGKVVTGAPPQPPTLCDVAGSCGKP